MSIIKERSSIDLTEGVIWRQLLRFSFPMILGDLFQQIYNTADSIIAGNLIGKQALASVCSTASVINIMIGILTGIGTGTTVVIARYFGARDRRGLSDSIGNSVILTDVMCVLLTVGGLLLTPYMIRLLAVPEDVRPSAEIYLTIYFAGISGVVMYNMFSGILRALGNSRVPMIALIVSSVLNIGLDLLSICALGMGVAGVALATVVSQLISAGILFLFLISASNPYRLELKGLRFSPAILRKIVGIGLPMGIQKSLISFSNTIVISYINRFGSGAMAAWGVYQKLNTFVMQITQSMSLTVSAFVSQNLGAGRNDRVKKGLVSAYAVTLSITAVLVTFMVSARFPLIRLFSSDAEVVLYSSMIICFLMPLQAIGIIVNLQAGALRGRGLSKGPMYIMLFAYVVVRQIYLHLGWPHFGSARFAVSCYPVAWCCALILMNIYGRHAVSAEKDPG